MDLLKPLGLLLAGLAALACAHGGSDDRSERAVPAREREAPRSVAAAPPPREVSTDRVLGVDAGAGSPERAASQSLVEEGKGYLIAGQAGEAERRFDRATRIDPTNGFAYYFLGRARVASGDRNGAIGVLEKAESLLGPYPEWRERAARLIGSLRGR